MVVYGLYMVYIPIYMFIYSYIYIEYIHQQSFLYRWYIPCVIL